jgi:hypothetical protein
MILRAESIHCRWRSVQRAANPNRGGSVTWLTVPHPAGDTLYATREGVESQGAVAIETQDKVAWGGAPILQDAWLHGDFGFLANTVLADQVLQSSYVYPENMDTHTKLLLQEAQHIFHRLSKEEVVDFVSTTDFQSYSNTPMRIFSPSNLGVTLDIIRQPATTGIFWQCTQPSQHWPPPPAYPLPTVEMD